MHTGREWHKADLVFYAIDVRYWLDRVAKLSLRLRWKRDSVDQDVIRGSVDEGAAGSRTKPIFLRV